MFMQFEDLSDKDLKNLYFMKMLEATGLHSTPSERKAADEMLDSILAEMRTRKMNVDKLWRPYNE